MNEPDEDYQAPRAGYQGNGHIIYENVSALSLSQRLGRLRFVCYTFTAVLIAVLFLVLVTILTMTLSSHPAVSVGLMVVFGVIALLLAFYSLFLSVRRLHDMGRTGWLLLLWLVPLLSIPVMVIMPTADTLVFLMNLTSPLLYLYLMVGEGDAGMNRYGTPNPPNSGIVIFFGGIAWVLSVTVVLFQVGILGMQYAAPEKFEKLERYFPQYNQQYNRENLQDIFERLKHQ